MKCREVQLYLCDLAAGTIPPAQRAAVETHLAHCARCRERLREQQEVQFWLDLARIWPEELPTFTTTPQQILAARQLSPPKRKRPPGWLVVGIGASLCGGLALALWWWLTPSLELAPYQTFLAQWERETLLATPTIPGEEVLFPSRPSRAVFLSYAGLPLTWQREAQSLAARLERAVAHHSRANRARLLLAPLYLARGDPERSLRLTEELARQHPQWALPQRLLSETYRQERNLDQALWAANQALARDPHNPLLYCQRGAVYVTAGDLEAADRDFARALELNPRLEVACYGRGLVVYEWGRYREARDWFERALACDPNYLRARSLLGLVYYTQSQPQAAVEELERVLQKQPDYPLAHLILGTVYKGLNQSEKAIEHYRQAVLLDPQDIYAPIWLGHLYLQANRAAEAAAFFQQLAQQRPQAGVVHLQLGRACVALGRWEEALSELQRAKELSPDLPLAWTELTALYTRLDRWEEALRLIVQAARQFPESLRVQEMLERTVLLAPQSPARREALTVLRGFHGPAVERFLNTVKYYVAQVPPRQQRFAQRLLREALTAWEEGEVLAAEQKALELCESLDWGVAISLGPANESRGLRLVDWSPPRGDGASVPLPSLGGRSARRTDVENQQYYLYFDLPDAFRPQPGRGTFVLVEYYDEGQGGFVVEYDSTDTQSPHQGAYKRSETVLKGDTHTWRTHCFWLPDAAFRGRQNGSADFRLLSRWREDTAFHQVRVILEPET